MVRAACLDIPKNLKAGGNSLGRKHIAEKDLLNILGVDFRHSL